MKTHKLDSYILKLVELEGKILPKDIRAALSQQGYSEPKVRSAMARLWDEGKLNVGLDKKLYLPKA